jgi:hypothetical protein
MIPALIAGAAALGAAGLSYAGQHKANKSSAKSVKTQMDFQERMSSTAHQRQMDDMRLAGLNPILSGKFGGASTPSGASVKSENEAENVSSSALSVLRAKAELQNLKAQNANLLSQNVVNVATAKKLNAEADMIPLMRGKEEVISDLYRTGHSVGKKVVEHVVNTGKNLAGRVVEGGKNIGASFKKGLHHFGSYLNSGGTYVPPHDR